MSALLLQLIVELYEVLPVVGSIGDKLPVAYEAYGLDAHGIAVNLPSDGHGVPGKVGELRLLAVTRLNRREKP